MKPDIVRDCPRQLGATQLTGGLDLGLERLILHQVESLLVGHITALQPNIQDRIASRKRLACSTTGWQIERLRNRGAGCKL